MARKTNGELLNNIDKILAVVANDVSYLREGHITNSKKIETMNDELKHVSLQLSKGTGKIHQNRSDIDFIRRDVDSKIETIKTTGFRFIDIIFAIVMMVLAVVSLIR